MWGMWVCGGKVWRLEGGWGMDVLGRDWDDGGRG